MNIKAITVENVKVLSIESRFDMHNATNVRSWLDKATSNQPANIVVNLSQVQFMDSTALSTLIDGMKRSRLHNGDLRLCGLQQPVRMLFELTRLDRVFEIYIDENDAVDAFKS